LRIAVSLEEDDESDRHDETIRGKADREKRDESKKEDGKCLRSGECEERWKIGTKGVSVNHRGELNHVEHAMIGFPANMD
jgi:hypothetical protein